MSIANPDRSAFTQYAADAIDKILALWSSLFEVEHHEDGTHADVTVDSLTVADPELVSDGNVTGDLIPSEDGTYSLGGEDGATTRQWKDLFLSDHVYFGGSGSYSLTHTGGDVSARGILATTQRWTWFQAISGATVLLRIGDSVSIGGASDPEGVEIPKLDVTSTLHATNGYKERGRSVVMGEWTTPSYSAGNFTAQAGSWTVDSGDIGTYEYAVVGKWMTVIFEIDGTDVSTTPTELYIAIPGGFTAAKRSRGEFQAIDAGGAAAYGIVRVQAADTTLRLQSTVGGGGWTATSADDTTVRGHLTFEIQ